MRLIEMMADRMARACATMIPRCGACHKALGPANEPVEKVGSVVIACDTCAVRSPRRGEGCKSVREPAGKCRRCREWDASRECGRCGFCCDCAETGCNCWVRDRPPEERFSIRYGAHDVRCPMWAPSLDPVDAANDAELRLRLDR